MPSNTNTPLKELMKTLYEALMREVEPELTSDFKDDLDVVYADETPEEHRERVQGYVEAVQEVNRRFGILIDTWKSQLLAFKKAALEKANARQERDDEDATTSLIQQFDVQP